MNYIVWDKRSEYDGYDQIHCDTWEDVVATLEKLLKPWEHRKLLSGKVDQIIRDHTNSKSGIYQEVFVTTAPITEPIK